jgi:hypothetical protein
MTDYRPTMDRLSNTKLRRFQPRFHRLIGLILRVRTSVRSDLVEGPHSTGQMAAFHPLIAEFLSDNFQQIARRKSEISADEWNRAFELGIKYVERNGTLARNGSPLQSGRSAIVRFLDGTW